MVQRRMVFGFVSLAGVVALAGLVGCGAAPESEGESTQQALPRGGLGVGGGGGSHNIVVVDPPFCLPSNEFPYAPIITTSTMWCSVNTASVLNAPRALDSTNVFEAQLLALGCASSVSAVTGPTVPPGGTGFSYAVCPDTCEVRALVHGYHDIHPFDAQTSTVRITACSATPPAGHVFAIWDPHCPSSCELPDHI